MSVDRMTVILSCVYDSDYAECCAILTAGVRWEETSVDRNDSCSLMPYDSDYVACCAILTAGVR